MFFLMEKAMMSVTYDVSNVTLDFLFGDGTCDVRANVTLLIYTLIVSFASLVNSADQREPCPMGK